MSEKYEYPPTSIDFGDGETERFELRAYACNSSYALNFQDLFMRMGAWATSIELPPDPGASGYYARVLAYFDPKVRRS